jgi:cleavage and polyadenylation specificity factor subunit 3
MPADGDVHANRQELLLILDEYWQANPHLQNIPIFYALKLPAKAPRVSRTFSNLMNARIRSQMDVSNPFWFRFIQNLKSIDVNAFDDTGPSVVFAAPGMLQSGVSRQLFDRWAADPKNGVTYYRGLGDRDTRRCLRRR